MKNTQKYKIEDYAGMEFSKLTVIGEVYIPRNLPRKKYVRKFECKCVCGNICQVLVNDIITGNTKSCGCWKEIRDSFPKSHGMRDTRQYSVWCGMIARCENPKERCYSDYGGRGISICKEWRESFESFWSDMKDSYQENLELDRIDVNGSYCKENCRWVTKSIQSHNKRKRKNCISQYIGVTLIRTSLKWASVITISKGNRKRLGTFLTEYQAALAYDNTSEEIYGDRPNKTTRET